VENKQWTMNKDQGIGEGMKNMKDEDSSEWNTDKAKEMGGGWEMNSNQNEIKYLHNYFITSCFIGPSISEPAGIFTGSCQIVLPGCDQGRQ